MRFLKLVKWLAVVAVYALGLALALPLFVLFMRLDEETTTQYLRCMSLHLKRAISNDFGKLRD